MNNLKKEIENIKEKFVMDTKVSIEGIEVNDYLNLNDITLTNILLYRIHNILSHKQKDSVNETKEKEEK